MWIWNKFLLNLSLIPLHFKDFLPSCWWIIIFNNKQFSKCHYCLCFIKMVPYTIMISDTSTQLGILINNYLYNNNTWNESLYLPTSKAQVPDWIRQIGPYILMCTFAITATYLLCTWLQLRWCSHKDQSFKARIRRFVWLESVMTKKVWVPGGEESLKNNLQLKLHFCPKKAQSSILQNTLWCFLTPALNYCTLMDLIKIKM